VLRHASEGHQVGDQPGPPREHEALARHLGIDVYFAHPYASWERGTSENTNRLLRQYYPKGTDFAEVSHYDLANTVECFLRRSMRRRRIVSSLSPYSCQSKGTLSGGSPRSQFCWTRTIFGLDIESSVRMVGGRVAATHFIFRDEALG
jgi:hypothetical protein